MLLLLVLIVFLGGWVWQVRPWEGFGFGESLELDKPGRVFVSRVVDGDTVVLSDGRTIRYIGIDAPEAAEGGFEEARRRNEELVLGQVVRLEYDLERQDDYGRDLAYVFVGEDMVNLKLLEEGLAQILIIDPNLKYVGEFVAAENIAP